MKKIIHLYTGNDGESHFEDIEIPLKEKIGNRQESKPLDAKSIIFRESEGKKTSARHNAPRRQFLIILGGELEIEVGDGTKRRLVTGDVLLAEDTTGRGHVSRTVDRKAVVVPLD